jgi:4-hydroxyphenylpyruvate dioxygenase
MVPALAQVCSLDSPFDKDIEDYAAGACRAVEVWLGKLETYLARHAVDDVRALFARHESMCPVAAYQGGLFAPAVEARQAHWGHFAQRLDLCRQLDIGTLVVAADIAGPLSQEVLDGAADSLASAARQAGERGVRLALEFQARAAFCNNLQTAAALVADVASPHLGICLDAFHYYLGPSKPEDLGLLTAENLFHVQLCDLAGMPRELAADGDRILPGEGDMHLAPILETCRRLEYGGYVSIELMNPQIWRVPARQFGEVAMTALRKLLGQASME